MTEIDNRAKERIKELEETIHDLVVVNDLQSVRIDELEAELKAAKGQYHLLLSDYRVADTA